MHFTSNSQSIGKYIMHFRNTAYWESKMEEKHIRFIAPTMRDRFFWWHLSIPPRLRILMEENISGQGCQRKLLSLSWLWFLHSIIFPQHLKLCHQHRPLIIHSFTFLILCLYSCSLGCEWLLKFCFLQWWQ